MYYEFCYRCEYCEDPRQDGTSTEFRSSTEASPTTKRPCFWPSTRARKSWSRRHYHHSKHQPERQHLCTHGDQQRWDPEACWLSPTPNRDQQYQQTDHSANVSSNIRLGISNLTSSMHTTLIHHVVRGMTFDTTFPKKKQVTVSSEIEGFRRRAPSKQLADGPNNIPM